MSYSKEDLAKYRLERAKEAIEEAKLLSSTDHWNTTANRLYYGCFYATSAYLVVNGHKAFTHSGIKSSFNKELIKTKLLPTSNGLLYNKLFSIRQDADYRDYKDVTKEEIEPLIKETEGLVSQIEGLVSKG